MRRSATIPPLSRTWMRCVARSARRHAARGRRAPSSHARSTLRAVGRVKKRHPQSASLHPESSTHMPSALPTTAAPAALASTESIRLVLDTVAARNPHEPEFLQAVHEVLESIAPVLEAHPEFIDGGILERLV